MSSARTQDNQGLYESFVDRHLGPSLADQQAMLKFLGFNSLEDFVEKVVPARIRLKDTFDLSKFSDAQAESEALERLRQIAQKNKVYRSYIGQGYYGCNTPAVIQRNILENPGWYTQYTPYQAEISQGRMEALLNFQTMIVELTGLPFANASLLDEATAAAEALNLCYAAKSKGENEAQDYTFFVADTCHPQTIALVKTRAQALGIRVFVGKYQEFTFDSQVAGALVQYPDTFGQVCDYSQFIAQAHQAGALVVMAADILGLTLLKSPGELGADVAIGSTQRFGVPLGFGGPHAAYFSVRDEYKRLMPGRLIGVSKDAAGNPALRLSLQTREQHIRREKATSNICTAQVLLAVMASMYAVYHGPNGLLRIARRVQRFARQLAVALESAGAKVKHQNFFDTLWVEVPASKLSSILTRAESKQINFARTEQAELGISIDETVTEKDLLDIVEVFSGSRPEKLPEPGSLFPGVSVTQIRTSKFLEQPVFNSYYSETEFLRYVRRLESKDLSLGTAMIPLGSCTMKLNATSEMLPVTWPEFGALHPHVPAEQAAGYHQLFAELESALCEITGFSAVSLQPNSGAQGEYAGLLAIRSYHDSRGDTKRRVCLIPKSAHGTNPASAVMAGFAVVVVACDDSGNVDLADLKAKAEQYKDTLAALMITYPSTHGVFEETVSEICAIIHQLGGQVYMDGANLNAQVGLCKPAEIGADVCHINLHKTFCIPHGGGGPGMGPIGVKPHLAPFLPSHPVVNVGVGKNLGKVGPVSASPWGSASILPISWTYMAMMGAANLRRATQVAILNANYVAKVLDPHYPVLYRGKDGMVAHECILDLRPLKKTSGVEAEDVAKRLMDYGFHAPTVSFPVAGALMVEPTESESKRELDRFCQAMIAIRKEIAEIEAGRMDPKDNPLKNAPHTSAAVVASEWHHPYSREVAAFPTPESRQFKFWPTVARVDNSYGDRNLVCTCDPIETYETQAAGLGTAANA